MTTQSLTIGNITIRQHGGLYSLNDLHRASGGEEKYKPAFFLRNDQTKGLISEMAKGADLHLFLNSTKGRYGNTHWRGQRWLRMPWWYTWSRLRRDKPQHRPQRSSPCDGQASCAVRALHPPGRHSLA